MFFLYGCACLSFIDLLAYGYDFMMLNVQTHLPTWAKQTLSSVGENIGNPDDPRRTWSDFQREGIALSCPDYLLSKNCF